MAQLDGGPATNNAELGFYDQPLASGIEVHVGSPYMVAGVSPADTAGSKFFTPNGGPFSALDPLPPGDQAVPFAAANSAAVPVNNTGTAGQPANALRGSFVGVRFSNPA